MYNDIIYISMRPHVSDTRYDEVEGDFKRRVGRRIQEGVRTRLDPGLSFRGHQAAQAVQVNLSDSGQLEIKSTDPGKNVLKPDPDESSKSAEVMDRSDTVNDLFTPSSGVPEVVEIEGQLRVAFRTVRETDLFAREQEEQDAEIKRIVDNTVQMATVDAMDEAIKDVERRYPSEQVGSEEIPDRQE